MGRGGETRDKSGGQVRRVRVPASAPNVCHGGVSMTRGQRAAGSERAAERARAPSPVHDDPTSRFQRVRGRTAAGAACERNATRRPVGTSGNEKQSSRLRPTMMVSPNSERSDKFTLFVLQPYRGSDSARSAIDNPSAGMPGVFGTVGIPTRRVTDQ
ncbi:unnamed protein product, partial [Iphiclides podalirius]